MSLGLRWILLVSVFGLSACNLNINIQSLKKLVPDEVINDGNQLGSGEVAGGVLFELQNGAEVRVRTDEVSHNLSLDSGVEVEIMSESQSSFEI